MNKRHLICSSLEELWPHKDKKVLFLGEWCLIESRNFIWKNYNYKVVPYHWNDRSKFHDDIDETFLIYEEMLLFISNYLNNYHNLEKTTKYWRIIIGPWLIYMIQIIYDRWEIVSTLINNYEISGYKSFEFDEKSVVPSCMDDFVKQCIGHNDKFIQDFWHEYIFSEVLRWRGINPEIIPNSNYKNSNLPENNVNNFLNKVKTSFLKILKLLSRKTDYFLISSYLTKKLEIILQIKLAQLPKFWQRESVPKCEINIEERKKDYSFEKKDFSLNEFIKYILIKQIPIAYKEGFKSCFEKIDKLKWPENPKIIYTANSYASDDLFKIWMAEKSSSGVPIVIGQHGGSYGIAKETFLERHLMEISDKFISWGWANIENKKKIIPLGILKTFGRQVKHKSTGKLTLIHMAVTRLPYHVWSGINGMSQWKQYAEEQYLFASLLPKNIFKEINVRLLAADFGTEQKLRWQNRFPEIELDDGKKPLLDIYKDSRLIISTYNATTFLESMSLNIPTVIFWQPNHYEIRNDAIKDFELLKSVGLFHDSAESAAKFVTEIWESIDDWWFSDEVQIVKNKFCDTYCRIPSKPIEQMKEILIETSKRNK